MQLTAPSSRLLMLLRHQASRCRAFSSVQSPQSHRQSAGAAVAAARPSLLSGVACAGCAAGQHLGQAASAAGGLHSMHSARHHHSMAAAASSGNADWQGVQQISVEELKAIVEDEDLRDTVQLLDVREPWEAEESSIPHFTLLPLSRQQEWAADIAEQLDPGKHTIVLCHHGMRSNMVANFLVSEQIGFENVSNVVGGIDAYAMVDPRTPRY